jgi:hypothetical protein
MKEINEIIEYLEDKLHKAELLGMRASIDKCKNQLDNANKVAAKLQGAIDLFNEIAER